MKTYLKKRFVREKIVPIKTPILLGNALERRKALIVGGSGGIGNAIARSFSDNGCKVVIAGTNEFKLRQGCLDSDSIQYHVIDVTDVENIFDSIQDAEKHFDNNPFDIIVNAAGKRGPGDFWQVTPKDWDEVMDINLKSVFFICQAAAKYMKERKITGHILNIGSASALKPGKTPYEISKCGIKSLTLGLAKELVGFGIVVNCLSPGPTATSMLHYEPNDGIEWEGNPAGRMATPEEIAAWSVLLVSNLGDYVVGNSVYVTGGSGTICIDK